MAHTADSTISIDAELADSLENVLALKRQRNAAVPVAMLPVEILSRIFFLTLSFELKKPGRNPFRTPDCIRLCHICHTWRQIALDDTALWTRIQVQTGTPESLLNFMLSNSRDAPLHLEISGHSSSRGAFASPSSLKTLREIFRSMPERIQHMNLRSDSTKFLEEISGLDNDLKLFRVPNLRSLSTWGFAIPWDTPILRTPQLTHLTLPHNTPCYRDSFLALLFLLRDSPQLQILELGLDLPQGPGDFLTIQVPILDGDIPKASMPNLTRLALRANGLPLVSLLLSHIILPNTIAEVILNTPSSYKFPADLRSYWLDCALGTALDSISPDTLHIEKAGLVTMKVHQGKHVVKTVVLGSAGSRHSLYSFSPHQAPPGKPLSLQNLRTLIISHTTSRAKFWNNISDFIRMETLEVQVADIEAILQALRGKPRVNDPASTPFPALKTIAFSKTADILDNSKYRSLSLSMSVDSLVNDLVHTLTVRGGPKLRLLRFGGTMDFSKALRPDSREMLEGVTEELQWLRWSYGQEGRRS